MSRELEDPIVIQGRLLGVVFAIRLATEVQRVLAMSAADDVADSVRV